MENDRTQVNRKGETQNIRCCLRNPKSFRLILLRRMAFRATFPDSKTGFYRILLVCPSSPTFRPTLALASLASRVTLRIIAALALASSRQRRFSMTRVLASAVNVWNETRMPSRGALGTATWRPELPWMVGGKDTEKRAYGSLGPCSVARQGG